MLYRTVPVLRIRGGLPTPVAVRSARVVELHLLGDVATISTGPRPLVFPSGPSGFRSQSLASCPFRAGRQLHGDGGAQHHQKSHGRIQEMA